MAKQPHATPLLDQLETGPWPSFVTGLKRLAKDKDSVVDLLGHLEHSYKTRKGYWKGGTVGVVGYGGGVIPRFTEIKDDKGAAVFKDAAEFHTIRIMPPPGMHYDTDTLRKFCDIWEKYGSGLIALHGQSGDIMMQGCTTENVQKAWDEINDHGFRHGWRRPGRAHLDVLRRCRALRAVLLRRSQGSPDGDQHLPRRHPSSRPALQVQVQVLRLRQRLHELDPALRHGRHRHLARQHDAPTMRMGKKWFAKHGMNELVNDVVSRCPTKALQIKDAKDVRKDAHISSVALNDAQCLEIDNKDCVRCMHCINVMTGALGVGKDKGATILIGGKSHLKIGATMGTVIIPFMSLKTDEDYEKIVELAQATIDFFAENALEHERTGEMIERIGLVNFLEGIGVDVDANMVTTPRMNPYVRTDGWDEEVAKINAKKAAA